MLLKSGTMEMGILSRVAIQLRRCTLTMTRYLPLLLHCGTYDRTFECQRLLLASGADPSEATEDEIAPFEVALYNPVSRHRSQATRHD